MDAEQVRFIGLRKDLNTSNLGPKLFTKLLPSHAEEVEFDLTEQWDVSHGRAFYIQMVGTLPIFDEKKIFGRIPYVSNRLKIDVDGFEATKARMKAFEKMRKIQEKSKCNQKQISVIDEAHKECARIAFAAGKKVMNNETALMTKYFKASDVNAQAFVGSAFATIVKECMEAVKPSTQYACGKKNKKAGLCDDNTWAYTLAEQGTIFYCPKFFKLPAKTKICSDVLAPNGSYPYHPTMAGVTIHEMSHMADVANPDNHGYDYGEITRLDFLHSINNARSYELYASAIEFGC